MVTETEIEGLVVAEVGVAGIVEAGTVVVTETRIEWGRGRWGLSGGDDGGRRVLEWNLVNNTSTS